MANLNKTSFAVSVTPKVSLDVSDGLYQAQTVIQENVRKSLGGNGEITGDDVIIMDTNNNGSTYVYIAIRRPDGYVGKPPELGTGVFAMDTGAGSSTIPNFDSGFPVDWSLYREPASVGAWVSGARMTGIYTMQTNANYAQTDYSNWVWDSNVGWCKDGSNSALQSWMFKRHAGFDVVTYTGDGVSGHEIRHNLNKIPEMAWIKDRDGTNDWGVYHKDTHSSIPEKYSLKLNEEDDRSYVGDGWFFPPTSTTFKLGVDYTVNQVNKQYLMLLFASVDGISKVGSYSGSDSTKNITDVGFQPRFLILKNITTGGEGYNWYVFDTTRGWGSGADKALMLDDTAAQLTSTDYGAPTSTGFDLVGNKGGTNDAGQTYIYYAHA